METHQYFQAKREEWEKSQSLRRLKKPNGIDFCSNDYLGLAENPVIQSTFIEKLKSNPMGASSSRLLRGHSENVEILERTLAKFSDKESALFFPSGYQANVGLFSSLLKTDAVVFSDELVHASIIDGIKLSGAEKYIWPHSDLSVLEMLLKQKVNPRKMNFVVVESIYSMRGDFAPLEPLVDLCESYGAQLIVDEAHATGLFGQNGAGVVCQQGLNDRVYAKIHTAGKALGVSGAWIAGPQELIDHLVNTSRPFIYSTAPAFYQQLAVESSLEFLETHFVSLNSQFKDRIFNFQKQIQTSAKKYSMPVFGERGPVTSLVCGTNEKALSMMQKLCDHGFDVRAVRPPSVPKGESLLRITNPLSRSDAEIRQFLEALEQSLEAIH